MTEQKYKFKKIVDLAIKIAEQNYKNIIRFKDKRFHFSIMMKTEEAMVRVVFEKASEKDKKILEEFSLPPSVRKELWIKTPEISEFQRLVLLGDVWEKLGNMRLEKKEIQGKIKQVICFIFCKERNVIKIGRSTNPNRRLLELKSYLFEPVELIGIKEVENPRKYEKFLHEKFKSFHIKGEWFKFADEIKEFIKNG